MTELQAKTAKHIHIIGIGGSAMAPLAGMLRESGFRVTGSDSGVYPPLPRCSTVWGLRIFHPSKQRISLRHRIS